MRKPGTGRGRSKRNKGKEMDTRLGTRGEKEYLVTSSNQTLLRIQTYFMWRGRKKEAGLGQGGGAVGEEKKMAKEV